MGITSDYCECRNVYFNFTITGADNATHVRSGACPFQALDSDNVHVPPCRVRSYFFQYACSFFLGPRLELTLGSRQFLWLYFISGIMGAFLSIFFSPHTAIVGASGAVYGVMLGFAFHWPTEPIYIYGILPIQARWLVVIMTGLSLFGGFGGMSDGTAHFAHLGGFLGGYLYLKFMTANSRAAKFQRQFEKPEVSSADIERWKTISRDQLHPVNRDELDRLMNKINTGGVQNLTSSERDFLDRFSHR